MTPSAPSFYIAQYRHTEYLTRSKRASSNKTYLHAFYPHLGGAKLKIDCLFNGVGYCGNEIFAPERLEKKGFGTLNIC